MNDIKINNLRIAIINELIRAREEQGISQKKLEELSRVKQPVIARIEKGKSSPNTDTLVKLLTPLGKKLVIVPLESIENTK